MYIIYFFLALLFALAYLFLIAFYLKGWMKMSTQNIHPRFKAKHFFTVIVSVRNEADNIEKCIESISQQNYPKELFQIILVDDFSTDKTVEVAQKMKIENLSIYQLKDFLNEDHQNFPNKKRAITLGVEKAKGELILTVDGDCIYPENWMKSFEQYYRKSKKKLITAPITYFEKKSIWNVFLQMDLASMIGITAGSISQNKPAMANGANLLFEKSTFLAVDGYSGNEHIASGDDVFLLEKIDRKFENSIGFLKNREAIAQTSTPTNFKAFINQRVRWTSKSKKLTDFKTQVVLVFNYLFCLLTVVSLFILPFFNSYTLGIGLLMLGVKLLIDVVFFGNILSFFNKKSLLKWILVIEILHLWYVTILGFLALFGSYTWKGRKVKK